MAEVTMSLEEYNQLLIEAGMTPLGGNQKAMIPRGAVRELAASGIGRKRKRVGKKDPKMARALRKANSMGRKKNGGLKKGWTQGRIMSTAHRLRRRM